MGFQWAPPSQPDPSNYDPAANAIAALKCFEARQRERERRVRERVEYLQKVYAGGWADVVRLAAENAGPEIPGPALTVGKFGSTFVLEEDGWHRYPPGEGPREREIGWAPNVVTDERMPRGFWALVADPKTNEEAEMDTRERMATQVRVIAPELDTDGPIVGSLLDSFAAEIDELRLQEGRRQRAMAQAEHYADLIEDAYGHRPEIRWPVDVDAAQDTNADVKVAPTGREHTRSCRRPHHLGACEGVTRHELPETPAERHERQVQAVRGALRMGLPGLTDWQARDLAVSCIAAMETGI